MLAQPKPQHVFIADSSVPGFWEWSTIERVNKSVDVTFHNISSFGEFLSKVSDLVGYEAQLSRKGCLVDKVDGISTEDLIIASPRGDKIPDESQRLASSHCSETEEKSLSAKKKAKNKRPKNKKGDPKLKPYLLSDDAYSIAILGAGAVGKSEYALHYITGEFADVGYDPTIEDYYQKWDLIDDEKCLIRILDTGGCQDFEALRHLWMSEKDGFIFMYSVLDRYTFEELVDYYEGLPKTYECDVQDISMVLVANKVDWAHETPTGQIRTSIYEKTNYFPKLMNESETKSYYKHWITEHVRPEIPDVLIELITAYSPFKKVIRRTSRKDAAVSTEEGLELAEKLGCPFFEVSSVNGFNVTESMQTVVREIQHRIKKPQPVEKKKKCIIM